MNEKIKKLKQFRTGSFAVWPFDPKKDSKRIHNRVVIIGLNPSRKVSFGENFHKKRFDLWYQEAFSKAPFAGSYMTDLVSQHEPKASLIIKKWKNATFKNKNVKNLRKQFGTLGLKEHSPIICLGQNTHALFLSAFPEYTHTFSIKHPNSYRMKNKRKMFLRDVAKIGKKIKS